LIVDAHAHAPARGICHPQWFDWEIERFAPGELPVSVLADYVRSLPVDRMIIVSDVNAPDADSLPEAIIAANERTRALMEAAPEVFWGSCALDIRAIDTCLEEMDRAINRLGFSAIGELRPQRERGFGLDSEPVRRVVERAVELGVGVNIHSSELEHISAIARLGREYPQAKIMMAHLGGFRFWKRGVEAVRALDNVWVDVSAWCLYSMGALEGALRRLGSSRVVFGTDFPYCDPAAAVLRVRSAGLSTEAQERIFWKNAAHIFRLPGLATGSAG